MPVFKPNQNKPNQTKLNPIQSNPNQPKFIFVGTDRGIEFSHTVIRFVFRLNRQMITITSKESL
jgi:hypothetical protein